MTRIYLLVGAVATTCYLLEPSSWLYLLIGASSVGVILLGVRLNKPVTRLPWYLMAVGQAAWVAGDVLYGNPGLIGATPYASDIAYLAAYPLLAGGIAVLVRRRRPGRDVPGLIDSAIVTIAFGLLSWVLVADPIVHGSELPTTNLLIAAAYPAGDILLLALVVRLVAQPGTRSMSFRLLVVAALSMLVADTAYAMEPSTSYVTALDAFWLISYVLWAAAALHPTMARLSTPGARRAARFTIRRLAALISAMLIAPALVVLQLTHGLHLHTWTVVFGASTLSLLVAARMAYNIEEIRTTARQRDELRATLFHEASHDSLTGVANNAYLRKLIGAALRRGQHEGTPVGLLLVDVDDFDQINDRHGHGVGDAVLHALAQRLVAAARDVDAVGRLGGDQFVVLMESVASDHDAMILAAHLLRQVNQPLDVAGQTISISASIGAATSMDGDTDPDRLLHEASTAIRRAKASGRGRIEVFDNRLRAELSQRDAVEAELAAALAAGQLEISYQPVVAAQSEIIEGHEAQLRWNHHELGSQPADALLSAVASDLICEIDRWTIRKATSEFAELTAANPGRFADLTITVRISGRTLASPGLVEDVLDALSNAQLAPHRLTIGVTEMVLVDVPNAALPLSALRHAGVFVSIDDFGTGRTPIGQIQHLPADAIKIHSTLVNSEEPGARDLLALLVNAAHGCGLLAVADGVDDRDQLAELRLLQCDSVQGLYSGTPDPAEGPVVHPSSRGVPRLRIVPNE